MYLSWYISNLKVPEHKPLCSQIKSFIESVVSSVVSSITNDRDEDQLPLGLVLTFVCLQKQTLTTNVTGFFFIPVSLGTTMGVKHNL